MYPQQQFYAAPQQNMMTYNPQPQMQMQMVQPSGPNPVQNDMMIRQL